MKSRGLGVGDSQKGCCDGRIKSENLQFQLMSQAVPGRGGQRTQTKPLKTLIHPLGQEQASSASSAAAGESTHTLLAGLLSEREAGRWSCKWRTSQGPVKARTQRTGV